MLLFALLEYFFLLSSGALFSVSQNIQNRKEGEGVSEVAEEPSEN